MAAVSFPFSSINPRLRASLKTGAGSPSSIMLPSLLFTIDSRQSLPASSMCFFLFLMKSKRTESSSPPSSLSASFRITSSTRFICAGSFGSRGMTPMRPANSLFIPATSPASSAALSLPTTPAMRSLLKIPRFSLPNFSISVGKTSSHTESMSSSSVVGAVGGTSVVSGAAASFGPNITTSYRGTPTNLPSLKTAGLLTFLMTLCSPSPSLNASSAASAGAKVGSAVVPSAHFLPVASLISYPAASASCIMPLT